MSKESPLVAMYRYRVSRIILFIRFPESQSSGSRTPSPDDIYCPFIRFNSVSLIYGSSLCTCRDVSVPRITNHTVHSLPGIPANRLPHVPRNDIYCQFTRFNSVTLIYGVLCLLVAMCRYHVSRIILFIRFPESQSSGSRTPPPPTISTASSLGSIQSL